MDDLVYLTEADVRTLVQMPALRARLREAFVQFSAGAADVPPRIAARAPKGFLGAMPGYVAGVGMVVKAVSVFAENHGTETPSHQGLIVVFDEHDGTPMAIIDGTSVTALRTAASAAVAADVLARPDSTVLAIIGGDPRRFAPYIDLYQRACTQLDRPQRPIGIHSPGFVAATDEEAREALWPHYEQMFGRIGRERHKNRQRKQDTQ